MSTRTVANTVEHPLSLTSPRADPLRLVPRSLTKLYSIWVGLTYPFASSGRNLSIHYTCDLPRSRAHHIKLGNSVQINKDAILEVLAPLDKEGEPVIELDDQVQIGFRCMVSAKNHVHIERGVIMAQGVAIIDHGYAHENGTLPGQEPGDARGGRIHIGQGSWIGQGAAIVCTGGDLVLGRNCVVAAKAVVTRSFPSHCVIFGNPARVIKQFDPVKNTWVLGSI